MYRTEILEINKSLAKTKKAIISLGCSFAEGQGAVDDILYKEFKWSYTELGKPIQPQVTKEQTKELLQRFPRLRMTDKIDFSIMEHDNSFVSVLCNKYFEGKYTPINLGMRGCGNRATVKSLYFNPSIDWHLIEECIVVYVPSSLERFDFINDTCIDHFRFICMWPNYKDRGKNDKALLWEGYAKSIFSEKFEVLEQIGHVQELMAWCKNKNAKLIITPGFERRFNRDHFRESLSLEVHRSPEGSLKSINKINNSNDLELVDLFPWDNIFKPEGYNTFVDLVMSREPDINKFDYFFQFLGTGSPDFWMTPCAHPSAKAHDLFASNLYKHIIGM